MVSQGWENRGQGQPRRLEAESNRQRIVDQLDPDDLRDRDYQRVVGQIGLDRWKIDRQQTFCTRVVARNEVLVVEHADDHPVFKDNPLVTGDPFIRFYVGILVVVDGVAVGTLCAMVTVPHELDMRRRVELFGLVHLLEQALALWLAYGDDSHHFALARDLVDARAYTTLTRYTTPAGPDHSEQCQAETKMRAGLDRLAQLP